MLFLVLLCVVKADRSVPCFQTNGGGTRLVLLFCLMFFLALELTIMSQTALITRGGLLGENGAGKIDRWLQVPGDTGVLCSLF